MQILGREVLAFNALKKSDAMLCVLKGFVSAEEWLATGPWADR
jgi:hypothetical protein